MEKDTRKKTKKMILTALMAAFTCIATMIIKIPTPTLGYIHLGDGLVLLCGFMLGPAPGALAAGTGSMFADIFSGYLSFAPATCIIKALAAGAAGMLSTALLKRIHFARRHSLAALTGGILGEAIMVTGYFLYEAGLAAFASGGLTPAALAAGAASSAAGIPFNIAQGVAGIAISMLLLPILQTAPGIKGHSS
ncbi:MAG: ECF transporter S component [Eubacterium sp.]|jgi:uncharacterized membrane protein|nr:ECF transporter S component [Eubacterium sp.]NBI86620.1 ECF transporter S component [Lachnospiraceae bacterium]